MSRPTRWVPLGLVVTLSAIWVSAASAYERYFDPNHPDEEGNCVECHGRFTGDMSPTESVFPGGDKHRMHRQNSSMATECNLCHSSNDNRNPFIGSSDGTVANLGLGCVGCHGRAEDGGNDSVSEGFGAGLRQHHHRAGVVVCAGCHTDSDPANYTPVGEQVKPPYYGTVDTDADDPCNPIAEANINENWTIGDTIGLDNDGDLLPDGADPDCDPNPFADPNGPYWGSVGNPVTFDGSGSYDNDGTIVAYDWDFGDGGTGTGVSPVHTYAAAGLYTVTLTVTDNDGRTDTGTTTADITEEPQQYPPIADPNGPYLGSVDMPVQFDGSGSSDPDGTIVAYDWDFGDGNTGTGVTPVHTYTVEGVYTVSLTVTDNDGLTDTSATSAQIQALPLAPPVNQILGMEDVAFTALTEADCRVCHDLGVPDRHHGLYDSVVPSLSVVPYPQFNTIDPVTGQERYTCMSCHSDTFILERDCTVCHNTASPHHQTALADAGDCVACHGDLVDNMGDGHYIPSYAPSLVTPTRSMGDGEPLNRHGNGAGACNYCHDDDGLAMPVILDNQSLHHDTNLVDFGNRCDWCHDFALPFDEQIRVCEGCHGPDSLHNIQVDSPNPANIGTLVVGGEDAGYGHVGRDAGPGDSDCWGCHGFAQTGAAAPGTGPIIPSISSSDVVVMIAGTDTTVALTGAAFSNIDGATVYESDAVLTAADGSSVTLKPSVITEGLMVVTIPAGTAPGNYNLQAIKVDAASNPTVISVVPEVVITDASGDATVTINGSGFGGYAASSGTSVTGKITTGKGKNKTTVTVTATIVSWSETSIEAQFDSKPSEITVISVYGAATSEVGGGGGGGGGGGKPPKPPK